MANSCRKKPEPTIVDSSHKCGGVIYRSKDVRKTHTTDDSLCWLNQHGQGFAIAGKDARQRESPILCRDFVLFILWAGRTLPDNV